MSDSSLGTRSTLTFGDESYGIDRPDAVGDTTLLAFSLRCCWKPSCVNDDDGRTGAGGMTAQCVGVREGAQLTYDIWSPRARS